MIQKLFFASALLLLSVAHATMINDKMCNDKGEDYIFTGGECIQYAVYEGEKEGSLTIIVHGTWDEGTNTLGRYGPFAETLAFGTDITTVAVALPGYSDSSTNALKSLGNKSIKHLSTKKEYLNFMAELIQSLKMKFDAKIVNYIGHSAGGTMGTTLTGLHPNLINNLVSVGGRYDIHEISKEKDLISAVDVLDGMDKNSKYLLIYGTKDTISPPEVTQKFYETAIKKGLNAKLIKVENGVHLDLDMTNTSVEAITELLDY